LTVENLHRYTDASVGQSFCQGRKIFFDENFKITLNLQFLYIIDGE